MPFPRLPHPNCIDCPASHTFQSPRLPPIPHHWPHRQDHHHPHPHPPSPSRPTPIPSPATLLCKPKHTRRDTCIRVTHMMWGQLWKHWCQNEDFIPRVVFANLEINVCVCLKFNIFRKSRCDYFTKMCNGDPPWYLWLVKLACFYFWKRYYKIKFFCNFLYKSLHFQ